MPGGCLIINAVASTSLHDPQTGQRLIRVTRRILVPGVHTAPGFGVAFFAPEGTVRTTLADASRVVARFFVTPFKAFPMIRDGFLMPALRCDGRGLTVTAPGGDPPKLLDMQLGEIGATVPIPWPLGSVGNPGPDYVPPKSRKAKGKES